MASEVFRIIATLTLGRRSRVGSDLMREPHFDSSIYRRGYRRYFRPDEAGNPVRRLRYVGWRPWRLVRTMAGGGVLPEWRETVRHHRQADVRKAAVGAGLTLERLQPFGLPWTAKLHLWWTTKRDVAPTEGPWEDE